MRPSSPAWRASGASGTLLIFQLREYSLAPSLTYFHLSLFSFSYPVIVFCNDWRKRFQLYEPIFCIHLYVIHLILLYKKGFPSLHPFTRPYPALPQPPLHTLSNCLALPTEVVHLLLNQASRDISTQEMPPSCNLMCATEGKRRFL